MPDPVEKAKDVAGAVAHPVDTAKTLEREAEVGASERTPWIAISGVTLFVGAIFAVVVTVVLIVYFALGGK